jgi:hypothetical protein
MPYAACSVAWCHCIQLAGSADRIKSKSQESNFYPGLIASVRDSSAERPQGMLTKPYVTLPLPQGRLCHTLTQTTN